MLLYKQKHEDESEKVIRVFILSRKYFCFHSLELSIRYMRLEFFSLYSKAMNAKPLREREGDVKSGILFTLNHDFN